MELVQQDLVATLVEECKEGNQEAFFKLYNKYVRQMLSISIRIVKSQSDAEDILQESFTKAFKNIQTFENKSTFGAWLKRIVLNDSLNFVKKRKIEFDELTENFDEVIEEKNEEQYQQLSVAKIEKVVQLLPDGFRIVLSLFLFEEYSHKEIAEQLNISVSTSKSQYNRAKKKLRELIIENYGT